MRASTTPHSPFATLLTKLPRISSRCLAAPNAELREFEIVLSNDLEALRFEEEEEGAEDEEVEEDEDAGKERKKTKRTRKRTKFLTLPWLLQVLDLALKNHKEAMQLLSPLQVSLSLDDERWLNDYMNQTSLVLEACNAISARISDLDQRILLIRYALHVLGNVREGLTHERASSVRKVLQEWMMTLQTGDADVFRERRKALLTGKEVHIADQGRDGRCDYILQQMRNGLGLGHVAPGVKAPHRDKSFLAALNGANAITFLAFFALALAFSPDDKLLTITPPLFNPTLWSSSVSYLLQSVKIDAAQPILGGCKLCLWDFHSLKRAVAALVSLLDLTDAESAVPFENGQSEMLASHIDGLSLFLNKLSRKLDRLGSKLNETFHTVVTSRSAIVDDLGKLRKEVCV